MEKLDLSKHRCLGKLTFQFKFNHIPVQQLGISRRCRRQQHFIQRTKITTKTQSTLVFLNCLDITVTCGKCKTWISSGVQSNWRLSDDLDHHTIIKNHYGNCNKCFIDLCQFYHIIINWKVTKINCKKHIWMCCGFGNLAIVCAMPNQFDFLYKPLQVAQRNHWQSCAPSNCYC